MTDELKAAGALPEPDVLARNEYGVPIARGYTADQLRAMMAERDAALRKHATLCDAHLALTREHAELMAEAAALRWELAELKDAKGEIQAEWANTCVELKHSNTALTVARNERDALRRELETCKVDVLALTSKVTAERSHADKLRSELEELRALEPTSRAGAVLGQMQAEAAALRLEREDLRGLLSRCRRGFVSERATGMPVREDWRTQTLSLIDGARPIPPDAREGREPLWRPISTAPKDMASYMFLCSGVAMQGFRDATGELCVCQEEGTKRWRSMRRKPTHWMPLPIGPAGTSADGETQP